MICVTLFPEEGFRIGKDSQIVLILADEDNMPFLFHEFPEERSLSDLPRSRNDFCPTSCAGRSEVLLELAGKYGKVKHFGVVIPKCLTFLGL